MFCVGGCYTKLSNEGKKLHSKGRKAFRRSGDQYQRNRPTNTVPAARGIWITVAILLSTP
jgi:hypothetical protein